MKKKHKSTLKKERRQRREQKSLELQTRMETDHLVVGEGWAAIAAAAFLASESDEKKIIWVTGSKSHIYAPVPALESGDGVGEWNHLVERLGIDAGEVTSGSYLREFKNKAFRFPAWLKAATPAGRLETRNVAIDPAEQRFVGVLEARFKEMSLYQIEQLVRDYLETSEKVTQVNDDSAIMKVTRTEEGKLLVQFKSGREILATRVIYADRLASLKQIEGLEPVFENNEAPEKDPIILAEWMRACLPVNALQLVFQHRTDLGEVPTEGFYTVPTREAGEKSDRRIWGYISEDQSVWTFLLTPEEGEDNKMITRKIRRVKQALNKMFLGSEWFPEECEKFTDTITKEQFRYEDGAVFSGQTPLKTPLKVVGEFPLAVVTDGFGPASAFEQVGALLKDELSLSFETPVFDEFVEEEASESSEQPGLATEGIAEPPLDQSSSVS